MGRWRVAPLLLSRFAKPSSSPSVCSLSLIESFPLHPPPSNPCRPRSLGFFRRLSAAPSPQMSDYTNHESDYEEPESGGEVSIPVKAYFLCTSVDLRRLQAENTRTVLPHTSRSSNYIALKYSDFPSPITAKRKPQSRKTRAAPRTTMKLVSRNDSWPTRSSTLTWTPGSSNLRSLQSIPSFVPEEEEGSDDIPFAI